jgi:asparagine synthase (glutamine-hydrolysing)
MFAFALWDQPKRRLLLVRDRLGIKPLYWARAGNKLLFGSEIKALLASGLVEPRPNQAVVPEVLSTRYVSGEETLFENIYKLLPGHSLVFEHGEIRRASTDARAGPPQAGLRSTGDVVARRELLRNRYASG